MKYLKLTTAMLAVISVSGCLGGGGGGGDTVTKAPDATYAEKEAYVIALVEEAVDKLEEEELTFDINLPASGSADYSGVMALPDPSAEGYIGGDFDMTVDFGDLTATGSAGNFTNSLDEAWTGNLVVDGEFFGIIEVDGTLISEAGDETVVDAEVDILVALTANGEQIPEYVAGTLEGSMTTGEEDPVKLHNENNFFVGELTN